MKNMINFITNYSFRKYTVKSLADAIDDINDEVRDSATDPGESY